MAKPYDHNQIETKWQAAWEGLNLFQQTEQGANGPAAQAAPGVEYTGDPLYLLFAFAYPSGSGLHVGHVESKTALDILARYNRMNGRQVFFPVGWDAFGLPAENYAIKTGVPPVKTTKDAIDTFRRQIKRVGISYDWANELATCHPEYYRWTQWLFLELFKEGLAYQKTAPVNWCPSCQTVLANEQVVNGECERCGSEVIQKEMKQWFFQITKYQDELISGLDQVDWPEATKQQQLNWIGKSEGLKERWQVKGMDLVLETFTTWPHTTWGATFLVVAPEHPVVRDLVKKTSHEKDVLDFCEKLINEKAGGARREDKDKQGIFTGRYAINPLTGWEMPIYVGNFALMNYGTGIVKACPAHDERDYDFAKKYDLPIKRVIDSGSLDQPELYVGPGVMVNAGDLTGMDTETARAKILKTAVEKGYAQPMTTYKLRDWLISRQRYWGAPIPIVYDPEGNPHPVKDEHLPWLLPTDVEFLPTGESPLRKSAEFQARVEELYGKGWTPEYDTMDTFVDSSWYYLRYVSSRNSEEFASPEQLAKWLPVDFYMIGPEHIVLHLLYSRFFTKFLRDQGFLKFDEPFMKMRHQGMIMGPDGRKMSKSKGNVINPDDVIEKFGADTLRVYEMFMGPIEADKPWDVRAVNGVYRFLSRIYQTVLTQESIEKSDPTVQRALYQTIRKVSRDIPDLKFNTAIAALMEFINIWEPVVKKGQGGLSPEDTIKFVRMIAPFAPFLADELHAALLAEQSESDMPAPATSVHLTAWPTWDEQLAQEDEVTVVIQVNGKVRGQVQIPTDQVADQASVLAAAKQVENVQAWIADKKLVKEIYVPGKIVNLVVA